MMFQVHREHRSAGFRRNANTSAWTAITILIGSAPDENRDQAKFLLSVRLSLSRGSGDGSGFTWGPAFTNFRRGYGNDD